MQGCSWLLAVMVLCTSGSGADGQCWDYGGCADLHSTEKIIECVWLCRSKKLVTDAESVLSNQQQNPAEEEENQNLSLGMLLSILALDNEVFGAKGPLHSEDRRSYSMEHFRWGKPMGRKRRPIKVSTRSSLEEGGSEEETVEAPYAPHKRQQLDSHEKDVPLKKNEKSTEKYRMTHFRWSGPPAAKRYGGFMKPDSEKSSKPLITLLRNIIIKDGR